MTGCIECEKMPVGQCKPCDAVEAQRLADLGAVLGIEASKVNFYSLSSVEHIAKCAWYDVAPEMLAGNEKSARFAVSVMTTDAVEK